MEQDAPATRRITLVTGGWVDMRAEMTGRDYMAMREVWRHRDAVSQEDIDTILDLLRRNAVGASEDVLELPVGECVRIVLQWYTGVDLEALPTETGTS